jgi:AcrR family transcriptional regulator
MAHAAGFRIIVLQPTMTSDIAARILEGALGLFAENGYAGVTITDIEKRAKVTRATIYQTFGSKEKLFESTLELAISRALDPGEFVLTIFENVKKQPLPALLTTAVERWYSSMPPQTARLLIYACLSGNKKWREMALAPIERIIQLLATGMEREISKRDKRFRPATAAKALILALLQFKVLQGKDEDKEVEAIIEQWLVGLGTS